MRDFMHPDRIVIGAFDDADGDVVAALHDGIDAKVVRSDVPSAEMVKLASNAALMTRVSFINEIANVCEATGADVVAVAEAVGLDRRIGPSFLRAGIGYGGSCFPKDSLALKQLAANSGYNFQLLNAVIEVNELQKRRVIGKLERRLGPLRGKRIALLGLAFKPGTDDMREAPSLVLAGRLLSEGAEVSAWDPVADGAAHLHGVEIAETALDALDGAGRRRGRDRVARATRARLGRRARADARQRDRRRAQPPRSRGDARARLRLRRHRPPGRMTLPAVILVGRPGDEAPTAHRPDAQGHAPARRSPAARVHVRAPRRPRCRARDHLGRLPPGSDRGRRSARSTAAWRSSTRSRTSRSARAARSASPDATSRAASSRSTATRCARQTSARWWRSTDPAARRRRSC